MHFAIDLTALETLLGLLVFITTIKIFLFLRSSRPSLAYSRLSDLKIATWRSKHANFPHQLHFLALISLMIAFIDPHFLTKKAEKRKTQHSQLNHFPSEGIAIYLNLDQSGSMAEIVEATDAEGNLKKISKIDLLKEVTKEFILSHPSDLIGLVSFARVPHVLVPLTLDRDFLLKKIDQIQVAKNFEEDGTAMGYAIFKTANLISATRNFVNGLSQREKPPYTIKSAIIIVVTDGFQNPSRLDQGNRLRSMELDEAATFAKDQNIRLYVINIDPQLSSARYAPESRQLQKITTLTGGQYVLVSESQELRDVYAMIDSLEKGSILQEGNVVSEDPKEAYTRFSYYPFFLFLGMISLFASLMLQSTLFRVVP